MLSTELLNQPVSQDYNPDYFICSFSLSPLNHIAVLRNIMGLPKSDLPVFLFL